MLEIKGLCKSYSNNQVLNELFMSVEEAGIYAFVGENGAGKTTTIKAITGLTDFDKGSIRINGIERCKMTKKQLSSIGYMPDFFGIYDNLRVNEYMDFYASLYGITGRVSKARSEELLKIVRLEEYTNHYVDKLSKGLKQKLGIARTLIQDPSLLILDEPTNGLDPRSRLEMDEILKNLNKQGKTILISSHILSELTKIATHIGILHKGTLRMQGPLKTILESSEFGGPLCIEVIGEMEQCVAVLKKSAYVKNIIIQDNKIVVIFSGSEIEEAKLLMTLVNESVMIRSYKREENDIEQIFMRLTERS